MGKQISLSDIKENNFGIVLRYVIGKGQVTRREIQKGTSLSWGTVSSCIHDLIEDGFLKEIEIEENQGVGRKATGIMVNDAHFVTLGMDINTTAITGCILNLSYQKKKTFSLPFPCSPDQKSVLSTISDLVALMKEECQKEHYEILYLGFAVQGKVDVGKGISEAFPGTEEPIWKNFPIQDWANKEFQLLTLIDHDPNALLFGMNKKNKLPKNTILIRLDNGLGMSWMQDGKIDREKGRYEIGQMRTKEGRLLSEDCSLIGLEKSSGKTEDYLFSHLKEEQGLFNKMAHSLSAALYDIFQILSPDCFAFTGKLMKIKEAFFPLMEEDFFQLAGEEKKNSVSFMADDEEDASFGSACEALSFALHHLRVCMK